MTRWATIIRDVVILLVINIIVHNLSPRAYYEWNLTLATIRALTILLMIVLYIVLYTVFGCLAKVNIFRYLFTVTIGYFLAIIPFYFLIFSTNKLLSVLYRELFVVILSFGIGGALALLYTKKISKANNQNLVNLKNSSEGISTNTANLSNTEDTSREIKQSSGETALSINRNKVSPNSSPSLQSAKRKSILEPNIADELISTDGTDIGKRILQIKRNLQKKSTNELCQIFYNQNKEEWTREAFIAMHEILKDRNASGTNELTCSNCGANSLEYDNYYKERQCTHCGHTEKDVRLILEATGEILGDRNQVGTNELTCSNCGANSFEYDSYYNENTCKHCGYIEKNHMATSPLALELTDAVEMFEKRNKKEQKQNEDSKVHKEKEIAAILVSAWKKGESNPESSNLLIKSVRLMHKTHSSDSWISTWEGKQGWTDNYMVYNTAIRIPKSGMKSYRNRLNCPTCDKDVLVTTHSKQYVQFISGLLISIYVIALVTLFIIGAGMLSVFGIFPGGLFFLWMLSEIKEIGDIDGTHHID